MKADYLYYSIQERSRNYKIGMNFILDSLYNHSFPDVDSHKIRRTISG